MTKTELNNLVQSLAHSVADDDTLSDAYDDILEQLALRSAPFCDHDIFYTTKGDPTYSYPSDAVRILATIASGKQLSFVDDSELNAYDDRWKAAADSEGDPLAVTVFEQDARTVRIFPDPDEQSSENLVANGTMELAATGWVQQLTPTTFEQSSEQAHNGTYSLKFTGDAQFEGVQSDDFTTVTGRTYVFTAWVYPDDTTTVLYIVQRGDDSDANLLSSVTGLTQDAWNLVAASYTENNGGSQAYVRFISPFGQASGTWYIDDVKVKEANDVFIHAETRTTDIPEFVALPIALKILAEEFAYPSDHQDAEFSRWSALVGELFAEIAGIENARTD